MICGHQVYKDIWTPFVDEILSVEQETDNAEDHFTVAIMKAVTIIGHVLHKVSFLFSHYSNNMSFFSLV